MHVNVCEKAYMSNTDKTWNVLSAKEFIAIHWLLQLLIVQIRVYATQRSQWWDWDTNTATKSQPTNFLPARCAGAIEAQKMVSGQPMTSLI